MRFSRLCSAALCIAASALAGIAPASVRPARTAQIQATVAGVRSGKTVDARTDAAEQLAGLTQTTRGDEDTAALVANLTSLLDSPDDSVRFWVATALGNIGPAARASAPKLEQLLPRADCLNGTITAASGIRYALIKMGVRLPPAPKCERIAG